MSKWVFGNCKLGGSETSNFSCEIAGSDGTAKFLYGGSVTAHAADLPVSYTCVVLSGEQGSMRNPPGALSS